MFLARMFSEKKTGLSNKNFDDTGTQQWDSYVTHHIVDDFVRLQPIGKSRPRASGRPL
jgi:hypothetical protein